MRVNNGDRLVEKVSTQSLYQVGKAHFKNQIKFIPGALA